MEARYFICWYDRDTDALIGEVEVDFIPFEYLQELFKLSESEELLYESQLVDHQQAQRLSSWIPLLADSDEYIYQLDCFPR